MHTHETLRARRIVTPVASALIALIAIVGGACNDGDDTPPATPTRVNTPAPGETPEPTPTPTEAPADPDLGATLEYEGELEAAIDVYAAVVSESDGEERQNARFRAAQLLSRTGRHDEARASLEAFLGESDAGSGDGSPARYMLASTLDDLGDIEGALANYERYIAADGVLEPFARVERAKMLARLGRIPEAELAAEEAIASDLQPEFESSFLLSMGSAFEQAGADLNALAWYERARTGGDEASALARLGAVHKRLGDPAWVEEYRAVIVEYPGSGPAPALLDELDAAGVATSDFTRGFVNYRAFRNAAAREAFDRAIVAGDNAASSLYYLAAIDERFSEVDAAIAGYQRSYDLAPDAPLADDALWWRGRLLEIAGRYDESRATYGTLVERFPASEFAADARFHGGMTLYRSGDLAGAAFAWSTLASSDGEDGRSRALFWQGRAETDAGNAQGEQTLRQLVDEDPSDFYALRAEVLLGDNDDDDDDADLDDEEIDWDEIAEYIEDVTGATPVPTTPVADDSRWRTVMELTTVGLTGQADTVYRSLINDASADDLAASFRTTRRMHEEAPVDWASRAATTLLADLPDDAPEPPDDLLRVAYPPAFSDLVESASEGEDVPPLLLLALVRQESFYDPDAGSSAGALGLTQVIEPTGRSIAGVLGVTDWELTDLFRPKLSLQFGANYLASQLTTFDGNAYHALAAYNGGPGTSLNAIESAGADVDLFAEDVEFEETRRYIRLVMEHYARYRQLYGGVGRPSLPQ